MFNLFGKRKTLEQLEDRIWVDRARKSHAVAGEILQCHAERSACLVVAHFPATLLALEQALLAQGVSCEGHMQGGGAYPPEPWLDVREDGPAVLVLSNALAEASAVLPGDLPPLAILVVERHPLRARDEILERFAAQWPAPVRLGFHLALDEPLLSRFGGETVGGLWQALGIPPEEAVSGHVLDAAIRGAQDKVAQQVQADREAESAEAWFALNLPGPAETAAPAASLAGDPNLLPVQCPHCGGALLPVKVRWLAAHKVQCPACGRQIKV